VYGQVVASGWYDIEWYKELLQAIVDQSGGRHAIIERIGILANQRDLKGIYRLLGKLLSPGSSSSRWTGLLLAGVGTWLLLERAGFLYASFWDWWPLLLIGLGARFAKEGKPGVPRGTVDAGHSLNALLGGRQARIGRLVFLALVPLGLAWWGWGGWDALVAFLHRGRMGHPRVVQPDPAVGPVRTARPSFCFG